MHVLDVLKNCNTFFSIFEFFNDFVSCDIQHYLKYAFVP